MTSCIVGKKIRAMGPGPLELFSFVVLAIKLCISLNIFYTRFQILIKKSFYTCTFMHYTCDMKKEASGPGLLELYSFVIFHYFDVHSFSVKDISGNTLPTNFNFCTRDKYDELYCGK